MGLKQKKTRDDKYVRRGVWRVWLDCSAASLELQGSGIGVSVFSGGCGAWPTFRVA